MENNIIANTKETKDVLGNYLYFIPGIELDLKEQDGIIQFDGECSKIFGLDPQQQTVIKYRNYGFKKENLLVVYHKITKTIKENEHDFDQRIFIIENNTIVNGFHIHCADDEEVFCHDDNITTIDLTKYKPCEEEADNFFASIVRYLKDLPNNDDIKNITIDELFEIFQPKFDSRTAKKVKQIEFNKF